jgi:hypothetical protein
MPFPSEHSGRLKSPKGFVRFKRKNNEFGAGIDVIYGITKEGKAVIQAIRFKKSKFTAKEARAWLKKHEYKPILFEPASNEKLSSEEQIGEILLKESEPKWKIVGNEIEKREI